jgi:regulator of RNase E activity RraA
VTDDELALFSDIDTASISDAMDRLGIAGQCQAIMPLDRTFRLCGHAFTVRYGPVGVDGGTVGDYIDDLKPGQVAVLDNQGRLDATVWGDLLTATADAMGLAGTVIDGVCRDSGRSIELGYPVFSRGHWMRTGKDRVRVEEYGGTVTIGGVSVAPGDILVGDGDGLVAVPRRLAAAVADAAHGIADAEREIREAVAGGLSLRAAREQAGYHALQARDG